MSQTPSKVRTFWLPILFGLGALVVFLLFRGCKGAVSPCPAPVNIDSLLATIPKDTLILPGEQITTTKTRVVNLKDTAEVNALRRELEENARYSAGQLAALQKALGEYQEKEKTESELAAWNMLFKASTWKDSVETATYRYWWETTAEGKLISHRFGITPKFPDCPSCEPAKPLKKHHLLLSVGGLVQNGLIRPIYMGGYGYKFLRFQGGYIPSTATEKSAFQLQLGLDWPIK